MAPRLTRRLGHSIDSAVIELFMSLNHKSMNEDFSFFNRHSRDDKHASTKYVPRMRVSN